MCLPRVKSKLDLEDQEVPVAQYCSPQRSFREKITDFFYSSEEAAEEDREGSVSPTMPVLLPQVAAFFHRDPSACPLAPATCLLATITCHQPPGYYCLSSCHLVADIY